MGLQAPSPATWSVNLPPTAGQLNAVRDALNFFLNKPFFKGSITTATALSAGTNITYPVLEDAYGGWDSANHRWVVPAGCGGIYRVDIQHKWGSSAPSSAPSIKLFGGAANGTLLAQSPNAPNLSAFMGMALSLPVRVAAGDEISVQISGAGFTTQSDGAGVDNNYFSLSFDKL